MASLEQRIERVEVHVDAHHQLLADLRSGLRQFEARVDDRFAQIDARFVQIDARFVQIDERFVQIDARFVQIEGRLGQLEGRFGFLEQRVSTGFAGLQHEMTLQFRWLVGIILTGMATIAAAVLAG